jgi:magnesium chelatase family protein
MLARRLTTILPAMPLAEAIETTRLHRVAGRAAITMHRGGSPRHHAHPPSHRPDGTRTALVRTGPFRAPHDTISDVGLIGGGTSSCRASCR